MKAEFRFPIKGEDTNNPVEKQPLLTSPYLENVRPWDVFEKRLRGGQRPAVRKWSSSRIGGGDYRIDKLVKANRGTLAGDCPDQASCEAQGYSWWGSACHTYPELPGNPPGTGTIQDLPASVWKCEEDSDRASVVWVYDTGADTYGIAVDGSGNVYVAGDRSGNKSVWKLDSSGNLVWDYDTGDRAAGIAVDSSGNVYIAGKRSGNKSVWKLDSDGNLDWDYDTGDWTARIAVDSSGNVYVVGDRSSNVNVWKLDSSGSLDWSYDTGINAANDVTIDGSGNVFIVFDRSSNVTVRKLNSSGVSQWSYDTDAKSVHSPSFAGHGIILDSSDNVFVALSENRLETATVWKLNSSGSFQWLYDTGGTHAHGIDVDGSDNVYVAGYRGSNKSIWKLDNNGNLLWSDDTSNQTLDIAFGGTNIYIAGARIT